VSERTRLRNQIQGLHVTAPVALRERIGAGNGKQLARRLTAMRVRSSAGVHESTLLGVLRDLARRERALGEQVDHYKHEIAALISSLDATLLDEPGIGPISAGKLLACDPPRFRSEAVFARCNGTAPQPASSGKTICYRLSRGGDRQVNSAIHMIALSRSIHHAETRTYLERKISEGKTKREAMRSLKRHLSRTLYKRLTTTPLTS
jgi:transposase